MMNKETVHSFKSLTTTRKKPKKAAKKAERSHPAKVLKAKAHSCNSQASTPIMVLAHKQNKDLEMAVIKMVQVKDLEEMVLAHKQNKDLEMAVIKMVHLKDLMVTKMKNTSSVTLKTSLDSLRKLMIKKHFSTHYLSQIKNSFDKP